MIDSVLIEGTEEETAGIASILADLIRGNLERWPERGRVLDRLEGIVSVTAGEGEEAVSATLLFGRGCLRVRPGADPAARVRVCGTFDAILGLTRVPMAGAFPHPFHEGTRAFLRQWRRGEIRITGLWRGIRLLLGLQRLVSVN